MGRLTLTQALDFTAVVALHEPGRLNRLGARWLSRWLNETPSPTLEGATLVVTLLQTLGTARHDWAVTALRDMAGTATSHGGRTAVG